MEPATAYAELGLTPGASEREVKAAWRRLVSQWHPDRNPSATAVERIQRINQAFEALSQALAQAAAGGGPGRGPKDDHRPGRGPKDDGRPASGPKDDGRPASGPGGAGADAGPAGRSRARPRATATDGEPAHGRRRSARAAGTASAQDTAPPAAAPRGRSRRRPDPPQGPAPARVVQRTASLSLEEALAGVDRPMAGRFQAVCRACDGAGGFVRPVACPGCGGSGRVRQAQWFGWGSIEAECTDCGGSGRARDLCTACAGVGRWADAGWQATVAVPPGARAGQVLTMPATAQPAAAGPVELQVTLELKPHPLFALDDDGTLRCDMPVDGFAWLAGHWVDVPTPTGRGQMRLRRGHLAYRLRGQGFARPEGGRGDLRVTVQPLFADHLSPTAAALVEQLAQDAARAADAAPEALRRFRALLEDHARPAKARRRRP